MSNSVLRNSAKEFAKKIVFVCRDMKADRKEAVLVNQLLRSATSIGANIHEAQYAQSTNDFISKLEIAQKEPGDKQHNQYQTKCHHTQKRHRCPAPCCDICKCNQNHPCAQRNLGNTEKVKFFFFAAGLFRHIAIKQYKRKQRQRHIQQK